MSYITAFITALCAACVFTGALYMLSPGGVMEKPVRYILGLVFLVIVISSAGVTLGTAEWDAVFPAADEIPRQSLDAASAEYVYGAVLESSGINFSEITVCTDKSDDGSIIITKVIIYTDCDERTVKEALGVVAENYEVEVINE